MSKNALKRKLALLYQRIIPFSLALFCFSATARATDFSTTPTLSNTIISGETLSTLPNGVTVQFSLTGPATVDMAISRTSNGATTPVADFQQVFSGGSQVMFWNALWSIGGQLGRMDGTYTFALTPSTANTPGTTFTTSAIQITSVDIHSFAVNPSAIDANGNPLLPFSVSYALAKDSYVTLNVKNASNAVVRHLVANQLQVSEAVSTHTFTWDGLMDNGQPVSLGASYSFVADAKDPNTGDQAYERTVSLAVTSLAGAAGDPKKLFENGCYVYPNPVRNGQASFHYQAGNDNSTITLKIYTLSGDEVLNQTLGTGLSAGTADSWPSTNTWNVTNQSGKKLGRGLYYCVFREQDSQGTYQITKKMAVIQ